MVGKPLQCYFLITRTQIWKVGGGRCRRENGIIAHPDRGRAIVVGVSSMMLLQRTQFFSIFYF
jgi:hypothetical protein